MDLAGKHYLLLPKLNARQVRVLSARLESGGFAVRHQTGFSARSKRGSIHIDSSGVCWSSFDPEDVVLPAIPDLLSCPKEPVALPKLAGLYFRTWGTFTRILTRMESGPAWTSLRSSGLCALTPDERLVALSLLRFGGCRLVTDFIIDDPTPLYCGRRRYFQVASYSADAASTLRGADEKLPRNSYLPKEGIIRLRNGPLLSRLEEVLRDLGEWCFFVPQQHESSNC